MVMGLRYPSRQTKPSLMALCLCRVFGLVRSDTCYV